MRLLMFLVTLGTLPGLAGPLTMGQDDTPSFVVAVTAEGPEMTSKVSSRFGQSRYFTLADLHSDRPRSVVRLNSTQTTGAHLAYELVKYRASVVITGKIGPNACEVLRLAKVRVIQGVSRTVEEALSRFKSGQLGDPEKKPPDNVK